LVNVLGQELGGESIDVVVVTALAEEQEAVLDALGNAERRRWGPREVHLGSVEGKRVLVLPWAGMGNPGAAFEVMRAVTSWRAHNLMLVGIAGGLATAGVGYGDVLVPEQIVGYEPGRIGPHGVEPRYESYRPDHFLLEITRSVAGSPWAAAVGVARPEEPTGTSTIFFGPVLSGEKVVAEGTALDMHRRVWPHAVGVEMEGLGTALASYRTEAKLLMVKGVSDLADSEKNDRWRAYAAAAAARFAVEVIRRLPTGGVDTVAGTFRWRRRVWWLVVTGVVLAAAAQLTLLDPPWRTAGAASTQVVSSHCEYRRALADTIRVCVQLVTTTEHSGRIRLRGSGVLDHVRGPNANATWFSVESLRVYRYDERARREIGFGTSSGAVGESHIEATSDNEYTPQCNFGFRAVMAFTITWPDRSQPAEKDFSTPTNSTYWSLC
jgi:nucleoside phosphorylase